MQRFLYGLPYIMAGILLLPLPPSAARADAPKARLAGGTAARVAYGQLPLSFEANLGQADPRVRFLAHGPGFTLFLTGTGAVLAAALTGDSGGPRSPLGHPGPSVTPPRDAPVGLELAGASAQPMMQGRDRLPGTVNYLIGNDPRHWHTAIPTYGRVVCRNVYPGIDQVWYGQGGRLEYDFVVRPGADPSAIRLRVVGAAVRLDRTGNLMLTAEAGGDYPAPLLQGLPVVYQRRGHARVPIATRYLLAPPDRPGARPLVRLIVAPYDRRLPLVIDPTLIVDATLPASVSAVAMDGAGNAYLTGSIAAPQLPTTVGAFQRQHGGSARTSDAFIAKLRADGSAFLCTTYLGGSGSDSAGAIAVDSAGIVVAGRTSSTDFPTTAGAPQRHLAGYSDAFVARLNSACGALVYATYLGGKADEGASGVALDGAGGAYVVGGTDSPDFPVTAGVVQPRYGGHGDAFVARLNAAGTAFEYVTYLGGRLGDLANAVAVDSAGSASLTGGTLSTDFPATSGAFQSSFGGADQTYGTSAGDAFVARLNPHGTALVYASYLGGSFNDTGNGIAIDGQGNAYVIGSTASDNFPLAPCATRGGGGYTSTPGKGCRQQNLDANQDAFVAALNPAGSALRWSRYLGGAGDDIGAGIVRDSAGMLLVTGTAASSGSIGDDPRFPTTPGAIHPRFTPEPQDCSGAGSPDANANCFETGVRQPEAFVSRLNDTDGTLTYASFLGRGASGGSAIAVGPSGTVALAGGIYSPPHRSDYGFNAFTYEGGVLLMAAGVLEGKHS